MQRPTVVAVPQAGVLKGPDAWSCGGLLGTALGVYCNPETDILFQLYTHEVHWGQHLINVLDNTSIIGYFLIDGCPLFIPSASLACTPCLVLSVLPEVVSRVLRIRVEAGFGEAVS